MNQNKTNLFLLALTILVYIWSLINPYSYFVWFLETFPTYIGAALIIYYRKTFPLSNLLYRIILIHMIVLAIGGHYTYAEVPLFNYIRDVFGFARNDYDKIGHFFQGVTPTLLLREIILRETNLKNSFFIALICIFSSLGFSALYEVFEWIIAVSTGDGVEFISLQGDEWDTQKDMFVAACGALFVVLFLSKSHSKEVAKLKNL